MKAQNQWMSRARLMAIAILAALAAIDIAMSAHAILTRHVSHAATASPTTPGTGSPTVMSVGAALGCATSVLLLVAIACVIIDARWVAQRQRSETKHLGESVNVVDV
jgi:hypothetical protein